MTRTLKSFTDVLLQQHRVVVLLLHIALIAWSLLAAWMLRYDFNVRNHEVILASLPILVLIRLAAMSRFNLMHGHWRYTGLEDAVDLLRATVAGSLAFFFVLRMLLHVTAFPLSLYFIECVLTGCLLLGVRVGFRVLAIAADRAGITKRKPVIVIGAGFAAQMIIRELRSAHDGYNVVGCLDDDATKQKVKVLGKPVLGTIDELCTIADRYEVREVLIAIPSATGAQMRRIVNLCEEAGLKFSTVPALHDLIAGRARIQDLREVDLDDLLGREPVSIDMESVRSILREKVVMVTGAAGSIGSELCRQILRYEPKKLVCLDQSETGLFYLQMELASERASYCVADFTNSVRMRREFATHAVEIVFHAAAYKHVPLMEDNVREALHNNVFGLNRLLDVAAATDTCAAFIMISSDKAVNPTSVMGATKRIGELLLSARPSSRMRCVSVRFGNVLGSQGSVVPVFQRQIAEQSRITVTHPEITRFFMTIREAVSLVLQASAIGRHGDVLVLDMGEPVRIVDLARTLIRLSGKSEKDVEIAYTGLRPGEKLYEELFYSEERIYETECSKIKRSRGARVSWNTLNSQLTHLRTNMFALDDLEVREGIREIIPEYTFAAMHEPQTANESWGKVEPELLSAASDD